MHNLTAEEKEVGRDNYYSALSVSRRDFLAGAIGAGVTATAGLGAMYFGYGTSVGDPVRVGVIGTGDEGGVLIGALNPNYVDVQAICDIRPYSIHRAFHGDWASPAAIEARSGLMGVYGWKSEDEARRHVRVYERYEELLQNPDLEAVIIALPLHLHHPAAMAAMQAGKHVLTEKLMAHNVAQCKEMARMADKTDLLLATGHQRHYSVLYDNAVNLIRWGLLGQVHHIRAQWHRGNLPGGDSWKQPLPGGEEYVDASGKKNRFDKIRSQLESFRRQLKAAKSPGDIDLLEKKIAQWQAWDSDKDGADAAGYGYEDITLANGRPRSAMEELCRWRLWARTGGGLMAELGSHQLDAASIFISALNDDQHKVHPLSVVALGGRHMFPLDRDCEDHVYCMYEFPAPGYEPPPEDPKLRAKPYGYFDQVEQFPSLKDGILPYDKNKDRKIVVTYSSINGNGFGGYGELVLGSKGTLILEKEQEVMLYQDSDTSTRVSVKSDAGGPTMDTQESGGGSIAKAAAESAGPVSRGYREEIEHWAWCIRNPAPENHPRCTPAVALGDAVIALTSNIAIAKGGRIDFDPDWFKVESDATPDDSQPKSV